MILLTDRRKNVIAYDYSGSFMYNNAYSTTETTSDGVITKHNYAPCYESTSSYYPNDKYYSYKSSNASGKFTLKESDEVYYMNGENSVYLSKNNLWRRNSKILQKNIPGNSNKHNI